ncbi:hypothetical protein, partial [Salmonella enterica]|uniref:hypothetical protein n=1 Tax=Salmonella enterica TaxID=28901 RepID=UPI003D2718E9
KELIYDWVSEPLRLIRLPTKSGFKRCGGGARQLVGTREAMENAREQGIRSVLLNFSRGFCLLAASLDTGTKFRGKAGFNPIDLRLQQ